LVLIDDGTQGALYVGSTLNLSKGYMLIVKDIDTSSKVVLLSLLKDDKVVNTARVSAGGTFVYSKSVKSIDLPIIAVHFESVFLNENSSAYINGIFQLSESEVFGYIP